MLDLEEVREEFSKFLALDPKAKLRLDAALGHVALLCYQRGMDDAKIGEKDAKCQASR